MTKILTFVKRICAMCGGLFMPTSGAQKFCPVCRKIAIRGYKKKYKKTEKGKQSEWKYLHSEKGRSYVHRRNTTEKRREQCRVYGRSQRGRDTVRRYQTSLKGKLNIQKQRQAEQYKLSQLVRRKFKQCIHRKQGLDTVYEPLGYTPNQAILYIKSLFIPGMIFEDRTTWCIHHIKPISMFNGDTDTIVHDANQLNNIIVLTHAEHNELHQLLKRVENTLNHQQMLDLVLARRNVNAK